MDKNKWLRRAGWFSAGLAVYHISGCLSSPAHKVHEQRGQVYIDIQGARHQLYGDQLGTLEHRVRGVLDAPEQDVRQAIERVLYERR